MTEDTSVFTHKTTLQAMLLIALLTIIVMSFINPQATEPITTSHAEYITDHAEEFYVAMTELEEALLQIAPENIPYIVEKAEAARDVALAFDTERDRGYGKVMTLYAEALDDIIPALENLDVKRMEEGVAKMREADKAMQELNENWEATQ